MRHIVKYGQNFLDNAAVARGIVSLADNFPGHFIIEIGPGRGALTGMIAARGAAFAAVEIDPALVLRLQSRPDVARLCDIAGADFMEADLSRFPPGGGRILFIGNLPYCCGAAIMRRALSHPAFGGAVFMLQKEVADRITAKPGGADYGLLSLAAQTKARVRQAMRVGRGNFKPVPKVDSAVLEFSRLETPFFENETREAAFFRTAKAAFAHRRKTVLNSLSLCLGAGRRDIEAALEAAGIDPRARAETISMENYLKLSGCLDKTAGPGAARGL
ncbi:MAG: 16S rRNA (adenine(1518)-N(6)/adenine(1519)-N(6))-dimethyltransferase RsmA [Elusimicrobiales bacterium]